MLFLEINPGRFAASKRMTPANLRRVAEEVSRALRLRAVSTASVAFVTSAEMRRFNRQYRGKDKATDVLSFAFPGSLDAVGDVLICVPKAELQAKEQRHSLQTEFIILLVHGLLHVFGHDHERPTDAKKMFPLQQRILARLNIDWIPPV